MTTQCWCPCIQLLPKYFYLDVTQHLQLNTYKTLFIIFPPIKSISLNNTLFPFLVVNEIIIAICCHPCQKLLIYPRALALLPCLNPKRLTSSQFYLKSYQFWLYRFIFAPLVFRCFFFFPWIIVQTIFPSVARVTYIFFFNGNDASKIKYDGNGSYF